MRVLQTSTWASRWLGSTGGGSFTADSTLFSPFFYIFSIVLHKRIFTGDSLAWSHDSGNSPSTPILCKVFNSYENACSPSCLHYLSVCPSVPRSRRSSVQSQMLGIKILRPSKMLRYACSCSNPTTPLLSFPFPSSSSSAKPKPHPPRSPFPLPTSPPRSSSTLPSSRKGIAVSLYIDSQNQPLVSNACLHACWLA